MKVAKGWRRIDNKRGFLNEVTGQNLVVEKKPSGEHFIVFIFPTMKRDGEGRKISPEFPTEAKAEAFASDWLSKHPEGDL